MKKKNELEHWGKQEKKQNEIIAKSQILTQSRRNTTCNTKGGKEEGEILQAHIIAASLMFGTGKAMNVPGSKEGKLI